MSEPPSARNIGSNHRLGRIPTAENCADGVQSKLTTDYRFPKLMFTIRLAFWSDSGFYVMELIWNLRYDPPTTPNSELSSVWCRMDDSRSAVASSFQNWGRKHIHSWPFWFAGPDQGWPSLFRRIVDDGNFLCPFYLCYGEPGLMTWYLWSLTARSRPRLDRTVATSL